MTKKLMMKGLVISPLRWSRRLAVRLRKGGLDLDLGAISR